ncbi:hypothetical protein L2E82_41368 [Cichorium intybus]|uniref:Uncharacterized protein n=1 Tax=Cichorium intybus TaxID=13427 RepID=A0ACB9ANR4_CICIN|nr:hypothetical protein L2E82_41368 [Cichorium intybus]
MFEDGAPPTHFLLQTISTTSIFGLPIDEQGPQSQQNQIRIYRCAREIDQLNVLCRRDLLDISLTLTEAAGAIVDSSKNIEWMNLFNELQMQHQVVATKTKILHGACGRKVIEKQRLIEFVESLRSKLNYFDELENVQTTLKGSGGNKAAVSEGVEASII